MSEAQRKLDELMSRMRAKREREEADRIPASNGHVVRSGLAQVATDAAVLEKCRTAKNAAKFAVLYDHGDVHAYHKGDDSAADLALLGMLKYWTQDPAQLERLFSASALGTREKWRKRSDYRGRTIGRALKGGGEVYDWSRNGSGAVRPLRPEAAGGTAALPYIGSATPDNVPPLSLVRFAGRPAPVAREFIIPDLIPRHHATTLYGWGGTAKSLVAVLLSMCVAGGRKKFLGRDIAVHGPVLYIDFELDADEQHRRVAQLAAGLGSEVPEDLLYVSTLGVRTHDAVEYALSACEKYDVVMVVLDSLGPAMVGDMAAARDVIEFHNAYISPFKEVGATPVLIDHQARQQTGEGYQSKGAFGSAYKEHLSRSLIQVERGDQVAAQGTLNVRLRHKKTNFGPLVDPFDVVLEFSEEKISATVRDLTSADRAQEGTLNSKDRLLAALEDGPAYPDELVEATGLSRGTVKNAATALKKAGLVEPTGEARHQMEQLRLVAPAARPMKGSAASATSENTVGALLRDPPQWLSGQVAAYLKDPERHLEALARAIAHHLGQAPGKTRYEIRGFFGN